MQNERKKRKKWERDRERRGIGKKGEEGKGREGGGGRREIESRSAGVWERVDESRRAKE